MFLQSFRENFFLPTLQIPVSCRQKPALHSNEYFGVFDKKKKNYSQLFSWMYSADFTFLEPLITTSLKYHNGEHHNSISVEISEKQQRKTKEISIFWDILTNITEFLPKNESVYLVICKAFNEAYTTTSIWPALKPISPVLWGAENGKATVLKALLSLDKSKQIHPSMNKDEPLRLASTNGHTEIAKILLEQKEVDPATCNNHCLIVAAHHGHYEIVKLLLQFLNRGVDPLVDECLPLRFACSGGHLNIVKLLIACGSDPAACLNHGVRSACKAGHLPVIKFMVNEHKNRGVNVRACDDWGLKKACEKGHMV